LTLKVDRAEMRFPDDDPFDPHLEFTGRGRISGYDVETVAEGQLDDLTVTFSSTPHLENEDLLLLVATGQRRSSLADNGIQHVAALEVARLYGLEVWESVFGRMRGESLLERISITTEPGADGDHDRIAVEVRLLDWLSAVGERNDRGDVNLDLLIFRWFP